MKRISIKNVNDFNKRDELAKKSLLISNYYLKIFQDFEFENLISTGLYWHTEMRDHYRELDTLALEIISLLEQYE